MRRLQANDTGFSRVLEMGRNLTEAAVVKGLSQTKPIRLTILGSTPSSHTPQSPTRTAIVSFSCPAPSAYDTELWVNPLNRKIFKSVPNERTWKLVLTHQHALSETDETVNLPNSGDAIGQPVSSIAQLLAIDTNSIPDKTMYYVEDVHAIYAFDKDSTDTVNPPSILKPLVGPGRMYLITTTSGALGDLDGGTY